MAYTTDIRWKNKFLVREPRIVWSWKPWRLRLVELRSWEHGRGQHWGSEWFHILIFHNTITRSSHRSVVRSHWEWNGQYCYGRFRLQISSRIGMSSVFLDSICSGVRKLSSSTSDRFVRALSSCRSARPRRQLQRRLLGWKLYSSQWSVERRLCGGVGWRT